MSQSISTLCRRTCADVGATTEKACCPRLFWLEHAGEKALFLTITHNTVGPDQVEQNALILVSLKPCSGRDTGKHTQEQMKLLRSTRFDRRILRPLSSLQLQ